MDGSVVADKVSVHFRTGSRRGLLSGGDAGLVVALERVSVEIGQGEFVALVGSSGCGKTTLLNLFAGLVQPSDGRIVVNGAEPRLPADHVGYMFARAALLPWRTAGANIDLGLESRRQYSRSDRRRRIAELLDLVGLTDFRKAYPRQLSQGMQQRVNLARTLAPDPPILLMDEPFAALDARTKLHLQVQFLSIWESEPPDRRKTVVFVTHDLQEAILLADRVVVMLPRPGRIAYEQRIDLPRPRAQRLVETMFTSEFRDLHTELFRRLEPAQVGRLAAGND